MDKSKIKKILIVCTGNSCRSVMAEGYLKKRFARLNKEISIDSAGTAAFDGSGPSGPAIEVMKAEGIDISGHKAASLTARKAETADLILVMGAGHKEALNELIPGKDEKIFYLKQFDKDPRGYYIPDPVGQSLEFYGRVFKMIKSSTEGFIKWLEK